MEVTEMGLTGLVFSLISIAAGAVMYWAVTSQGHGFRLSTVGVILIVVGAVGLVISTVIFAMSRRPAGAQNRTYDRAVTDTEGRTAAVHEEVRS
jgi:apolipoprotein N-acyltransferase